MLVVDHLRDRISSFTRYREQKCRVAWIRFTVIYHWLLEPLSRRNLFLALFEVTSVYYIGMNF